MKFSSKQNDSATRSQDKPIVVMGSFRLAYRFVAKHRPATVFVALASFGLFYLAASKPDLGNIDQGRLFLAGTTELLNKESYSVTQRPPFYSIVLSGLAWIAGISGDATTSAALEFGSNRRREVADELMDSNFQRLILFLHILLWAGTACLTSACLISGLSMQRIGS